MRDPLLDFLTSTGALVAGTLLALVSAAVSVRKALLASMDFQWSGAHLLLTHRDPWAVYLSGDPRHQILLSQIPNYLHELYVLLLPFGFLTFQQAKPVWLICNFLFTAILCWSLSHLCELDARRTWLLFVLTGASTPFRVTVGNGQSDALALSALALWFAVRSQAGRGLLLGIACEKYSFPPILVLFLLLRRRWKLLGFSLVPPLAGFLFAAVWLRTSWRRLAFEPFQTAVHKGSVTSGFANIIALTRNLLRHFAYPPVWSRALPYALALALAFMIAAFLAKRAAVVDGRIILACLLSASLLCFPHQIYDFLVLVFNLSVALKTRPGLSRNAVLALTAYFWYLERILRMHPLETHFSVILFDFLLMLGMVWATYSLHTAVTWQSRWEI